MTITLEASFIGEQYIVGLSSLAFYAVNAALVLLTVVLVKREGNSMAPRARTLLTAVVLFMFFMSTVHICVTLCWTITSLMRPDAVEVIHITSLLYSAIGFINCYIGDAIVTWRAWVMIECFYPYMMIPPVVLWMASIPTGIAIEVLLFKSGENVNQADSYNLNWLGALYSLLTLMINAWAVFIIIYCYWEYPRNVPGLIRGGNASRNQTVVRAAIVLALASGTLYCILWLVGIIIYFVLGSVKYGRMWGMLTQSAAMLPTLIVVARCVNDVSTGAVQADLSLGQAHLLDPEAGSITPEGPTTRPATPSIVLDSASIVQYRHRPDMHPNEALLSEKESVLSYSVPFYEAYSIG